MKEHISLQWQVGWSCSGAAAPERFVPAQVPGAVQLDWARAEGWGPHYYADNFLQYDWMHERFWVYRAQLPQTKPNEEQRTFLVCGGVDYQYEVRVDGQLRLAQEGMHTPFELDVTGDAGRLLEIVVFPAPQGWDQHYPWDKKDARRDCKPPVSYGWDFHPPLVPMGIWDETYLETRERSHMQRAEVRYALSADFQKADVTLEVDRSEAAEAVVRWTLCDRNGEVCFEQTQTVQGVEVRLKADLKNPELWWPNGHGEPVLYTSRVELHDMQGKVLAERESRVGFRTVKLVMYEGAWQAYAGLFPLTQCEPPVTFEINGRHIFAKGSNFCPPDVFAGTVTADTYRPLLEMVRNSNMNLLRCWGGGFVNKDSFFDLCDEMGIMVWQEFTKACHRYEDDPHYLEVLDQESRAIIMRLRPHASLALWCGGNEMFNSWSQNHDQQLHVRLTARNCFDLDRSRPYLNTSPVMGIGHGGYWFESDDGQNVFTAYAQASRTAYCEFGVPAAPSVETLRSFIPESELFPPKWGTAWQTHFGFNAWTNEKQAWLKPAIIEKYLGSSDSLEDLVFKSQLMQSAGYKVVFEEARRQKPRCSIVLNWCLNEPFPCAANNSLVAWPADAKPALSAVASSLRPVLPSARVSKFDWASGEEFEAELWMLNDSLKSIPGGTVQAELIISGVKHPLGTWSFPEMAPNKNAHGPTLRIRLPELPPGTFQLVLRVEGQSQLENEYVFAKKLV